MTSLDKKFKTNSKVYVLNNDNYLKLNKKEFTAFFVIDWIFSPLFYTSFMAQKDLEKNPSKQYGFFLHQFQKNALLVNSRYQNKKLTASLEIFNYSFSKGVEKSTLVKKITR